MLRERKKKRKRKLWKECFLFPSSGGLALCVYALIVIFHMLPLPLPIASVASHSKISMRLIHTMYLMGCAFVTHIAICGHTHSEWVCISHPLSLAHALSISVALCLSISLSFVRSFVSISSISTALLYSSLSFASCCTFRFHSLSIHKVHIDTVVLFGDCVHSWEIHFH